MNSISVVIVDSDNNSRHELKASLKEYKYIDIIGECDNLTSGYNKIMQEKPAIAFIDISENPDLALEIIEKLSVQLTSCKIFVLSSESDSNIVIKAMRSGAREFLIRPIIQHDLKIALERAKIILIAEQDDNSQGKIFTVFSNKGGIGKTTIATNLAVNLAEITGKKVALIDLNLQLGDVTTFLDINPSFNISYIVENLNRIDESFVLSTLEKYKDKELYILADPPYLEQAEEITSERIDTLLGVLKSIFSYIIIDTGSNFDSKTLSSLDHSDKILLISMINLPATRNSQRCLELFHRLGYAEDKIKLIINRYLPNDEISVEDVEEALGHPVYWKIPNNYFSVMSAINRGVPVYKVDQNSNISQNFMQLAALLSNNIILMNHQSDSSEKKADLFSWKNLKLMLNKLLKREK